MRKQKVAWFLLGAVLPLVLAAIGGIVFVKTAANGFSARAQPSNLESFAARTARKLAYPDSASLRQNPVASSEEVLAEARAHWADHCASCHANDGSGRDTIGENMYPPVPDMSKGHTQEMTDGELFYIIENGIRLSGMPAWGTGSKQSEESSWKLVHFIRHLPKLSSAEVDEMKKLNPQSAHEMEEQKQEEEFLRGKAPSSTHKHNQH